MSNFRINIQKYLQVSVLSNRSTAKVLLDEALKNKNTSIVLDFADIEFASRSFLDELNYLINENDDKSFVKINMTNQLQKMDYLVQKPSKDINSNQRSSKLVHI